MNNNLKKTLFFAVLLGLVSFVSAQQDPVVMEVGGQPIHQSELMKNFMGSVGDRMNASQTATDKEKQTALHEYADLYANFRAKLIDAHRLGLDTAGRVMEEFKQYRAELAAPYLIDSAVLQHILQEAYERNHYSLHTAHILCRVPPDASPEDTLRAYNRAMRFRDRILAGEDFYKVSVESVYGKELPPDGRINPKEGDMGYFTAFDMVYPFETAAYNMKVGDLSMPVRTKYGYHLIWLIDRVALHGKVDIAHIWFQGAESSGSKLRAEDCYARLQRGTSFEMVARQSDDHVTSQSGGVLKDARLNTLPQEYLHALETLKPGEYSKPFSSPLGWHIVKLIRKDTLPPLEDMVAYYKQRMSRDQRGEASKQEFARRAFERYGFIDLTKPQPSPMKKGKDKAVAAKPVATLDQLYAIVPEEATRNMWRYHDSMVTDIHTILKTPTKEYTTLDLARYIAKNQHAERPLKSAYFVNLQYQRFIDSIAIAYADSQLENEYPEFAELVNEYRRGLTIFNYNSRMIWSKALFDTAGFVEFYQQESRTKQLDNPDDSIYFWRKRARMLVVRVSDSVCLPVAKTLKIMVKAQAKGVGSFDLKPLLEKGMRKKCEAKVSVSPELLELSRQQLISPAQWMKGTYVVREGKGYRVVVVEEIVPPTLKSRVEARGYYMSAYQNELERRLNGELRHKYNVKIDWDAIGKISF